METLIKYDSIHHNYINVFITPRSITTCEPSYVIIIILHTSKVVKYKPLSQLPNAYYLYSYLYGEVKVHFLEKYLPWCSCFQ